MRSIRSRRIDTHARPGTTHPPLRSVQRGGGKLLLSLGMLAVLCPSGRTQNKLRLEWSAELDLPGTSTEANDTALGVTAANNPNIPAAFVGANNGSAPSDWVVHARDEWGTPDYQAVVPNRIARAACSSSSSIFIVGDNEESFGGSAGDTSWFIERRDDSTGNLAWTTSVNPTTLDANNLYGDTATACTFYASRLFVVGKGGYPGQVHSWRIEERFNGNGTLGWVRQSDPGIGSRAPYGIAPSGTSLYIAGYDTEISGDFRWVIEKRAYATGDLEPGFGSGGRLTLDLTPFHDVAYGIAADESRIYVVGYTGDAAFNEYARIEARDRHTGALLWSAGGNRGVARAISLEGNVACVAGYDDSCGTRQWRLDLYRRDTGEHLDTSSLTCAPASEATCISSRGQKEFFIGGYLTVGTDRRWRMEKRFLDLNLDGLPDDGLPVPSINAQPQGTTACPGASWTFSVSATSADSYRWRKNGVLIPGGTGASLIVSNIGPSDVGAYDVIVSNINGYTISSPASLSLAVLPAITGGPADSTVCESAPATFQVTATGTSLTYTWRRDGVTVQVGPSSTYTLPAASAADDGATFSVTASNACASATSGAATLTVRRPPAITTALPDSSNVCEGSPLTLTVAASGEAPLSYQWAKDGIDIAGATSASYSIATVTSSSAGTYGVTITNPASGMCGAAVDESVVTVIGSTAISSISTGTDASGVSLEWDAVPGAAAYRVYRADESDGTGTTIVLDWSEDLDSFDTSAIPGHSYYYWVATGDENDGECSSSTAAEGWRAITPPVATITHTYPDAYAVLSWDTPAGSGFYQVHRQLAGQPSTAGVVSGWIPATTLNVTGNAQEVYEFWVCAAIDTIGTHASAESNYVQQSMPCAEPGLECGTGGGPQMLVLIDRSIHMNELSTLGTRWEEAVDYAKQEVAAFFSQCPRGSVSIWTFAGFCVEDLTSGFVDRSHAELVLESLPHEPSDMGSPLASAMCKGVLSMCMCMTSGPCRINTPNGPKDRIMLVLTAGTHDGGATCNGPDALTGSNCSTDPFLPTDSWQRRVCNVLGGCSSIYAVVWDEPLTPLPGGASTMEAFAQHTGGASHTIAPGDPLPDPFFGDCNGNGVSDATDIAMGTSEDCNEDAIPDECQSDLDCNQNGIPDACDIASGISADHNANGAPDECEGFVLTGPVLPLAGVYNELQLVGGEPFGLVAVTAELDAPNPNGQGPNGLHRQPLPLARLDADGHARFRFDIPEALAGATVRFRARQFRPAELRTGLSVTFH